MPRVVVARSCSSSAAGGKNLGWRKRSECVIPAASFHTIRGDNRPAKFDSTCIGSHRVSVPYQNWILIDKCHPLPPREKIRGI